MNLQNSFMGAIVLSVFIFGVSAPSHATLEKESNEETLAAIRGMKNGEDCLQKIFKTMFYKEIRDKQQPHSFGYAMKTSDYSDYSNDEIRSIEIYFGSSVMSETCD